MATYQDNAELMNGIYKYGTLDEYGKDVTNNIVVKSASNPEDSSTWKKVVTETDAQNNPIKFLEINNTATGYYGAVYTNGSEYILVNRGTNNFNNKVSDGSMALGNVPNEFYDAYTLAKQASSYI